MQVTRYGTAGLGIRFRSRGVRAGWGAVLLMDCLDGDPGFERSFLAERAKALPAERLVSLGVEGSTRWDGDDILRKGHHSGLIPV